MVIFTLQKYNYFLILQCINQQNLLLSKSYFRKCAVVSTICCIFTPKYEDYEQKRGTETL